MKKILHRAWLLLIMVITLFLWAVQRALDLVGWSTATEDAKVLWKKLEPLFDLILGIPDWFIYGGILVSLAYSLAVVTDFSFDIFKREPKASPMSDLQRLNIVSGNFSVQFRHVERATHSFFSDDDAISAMSEVEIFQQHLIDFGITPPKKQNSTAEDILMLKTLVARYKPFLERGDYGKALEIANEASSMLS